jgi:hypothetical protein
MESSPCKEDFMLMIQCGKPHWKIPSALRQYFALTCTHKLPANAKELWMLDRVAVSKEYADEINQKTRYSKTFKILGRSWQCIIRTLKNLSLLKLQAFK